MFTKIAESKWLKLVLFFTTFAFVGTGFVALILYKLSGNISGALQINGREITFQEYFYELNKLQTQYQSQGIDTSPMLNMLKAQAIESVLNRELLYQFTQEEGINATLAEAKYAITQIPAFQTDGKFDSSKYQSFLDSYGISNMLFTEILQKQLSIQHLLSLIESGFYISDMEIDTFLNKRFSKIDGKLLIIDPKIEISENQIKEYYEKHKQEFKGNVKKQVKIYGFLINELKDDAGKLAQKTYLDLKNGKKVDKEKAKILFEGDVSKANKLKKLLAEKAKQISNKEKIIFAKDKEGFYIIQYLGEKAETLSYSEAKDKIKQKLTAQLKDKKMNDILQKLKNENIDFQTIAKKYNGKIENLKDTPISTLQFQYFVNSEIVNQLFKNKTTEPFKTNKGIVIIKISKITPPSNEEKQSMRETFGKILEGQKFNDIVMMLVEKLKNQADIKINPQLKNL